MKALANRETAKELDVLAQEMGMNGLVLMERAALSLADFIEKKRKECTISPRVFSICGIGNNGGDGLAAARILAERGYFASALILGEKDKCSESMKVQLQIVEKCGMDIRFLNFREVAEEIKRFENGILIDALFGVGLSRELGEEYRLVVEAFKTAKALVVSVDVPSGINADNGSVFGAAVKADMTVTFGVNKVGLLLYPGKDYAGEVVVSDIGFPKKAMEKIVFPAFTYLREEAEELLPKRAEYSHKGSFGKVLIIAGSHGMSGACFLSALAAYKNGAGLVKIFTHESNRIILQSLLPEAIMETYMDDEEGVSSDLLEKLERNLDHWADIVVIGSGLGKSKRSMGMFFEVMKRGELFVIIDADGISLLKDYFYERKEGKPFDKNDLRKNIILTPHIKELSHLLGKNLFEVKEHVMELAEEWKDAEGILVVKEAATLVAGSGKVYINATGNAAMAKAGSGDVLTGFIAAHLALGASPSDAASLGVYYHGLKGDAGRKNLGVHSVLARDLA